MSNNSNILGDVIVATYALIIPLLFSFGIWIVRKLGQHDIALALLLQTVNPPDAKSLREMLNEIQTEQAVAKATAKENKG